MADTSEVEFYLSNSEAFKKLRLPVREEFTEKGGICSPDGPNKGKHYLYVNPLMIEHVEFYVHEFTELIIFRITEIENRNILENKYTPQQLQKISHRLSKMSEEEFTTPSNFFC